VAELGVIGDAGVTGDAGVAFDDDGVAAGVAAGVEVAPRLVLETGVEGCLSEDEDETAEEAGSSSSSISLKGTP